MYFDLHLNISSSLKTTNSSLVSIAFLQAFRLFPFVQVSRIGKRLSGCIMSMMKSREIRGVHCQVSLHSHFMNGLLRDIGFHSVALLGTPPDGLSIMGMNL